MANKKLESGNPVKANHSPPPRSTLAFTCLTPGNQSDSRNGEQPASKNAQRSMVMSKTTEKLPNIKPQAQTLQQSRASSHDQLRPKRNENHKVAPHTCSGAQALKERNFRVNMLQSKAKERMRLAQEKKEKKAASKIQKPVRVSDYVALLAPENRVMLAALLKRLKWNKVTNVLPQHLIKHKFSVAYTKGVEVQENWKSISYAKMHGGQGQAHVVGTTDAFPELEREDPDRNQIDLLWVGSHRPSQLIPSNLSNFKVIFNGLDNIEQLLNMQNLRDQLLTVRSSILTQTQHSIPNFLLDKYYPSHSELVAVQKYIIFELKVLANTVVHVNAPAEDKQPKYIVETISNMGTKKLKGNSEQKKREMPLNRDMNNDLIPYKDQKRLSTIEIPINKQLTTTPAGFRRSVSFIRIAEFDVDVLKHNMQNQNMVDVNQMMQQSKQVRSLSRDHHRKDLIYGNLGDFLFDDNEEFRLKTKTAYIIKQGFSMKSIIDLQKKAVKKQKQNNVPDHMILGRKQSEFMKNRSQKRIKQQSKDSNLEQRCLQTEPIVVRQLLNPLLYHGNNICTISVYVFVESFETLRSYIFNNVKVRFRQTADYKEDADFSLAGFGKGKTLYRFSLEQLMKLLQKRALSQLDSVQMQKKVFWNRICQKVILMLMLMKTQTRQTHSENKDVPLSTFCHLLQFRFQIDRTGRPWLFGIKSDTSKFQMKNNEFDRLKRQLMLETVICINKKLHSALKKDRKLAQEDALQVMAGDQSGVEKILMQTKDEFQFGTGTKKRIIDRVLGQYQKAHFGKVLKTFNHFDDWAQKTLLNKKLKSVTQLENVNDFDTNFNRAQLAERRLERSLFLKLNKNNAELNNYYRFRHSQKNGIRLDPRGLQTRQERKAQERKHQYYVGEQQLIEDVTETLLCEDLEHMEVKVNLMKHIGSVLIREGFRLILQEEHNNDIMNFINKYKNLCEIQAMGDDWAVNSLKFVIMGVKDPLVFLCQCIEKLRLIALAKRSELRSFKILHKYDKLPNAPSSEQLTMMKKKGVPIQRRKSNVLGPEKMEEVLRQSEVKAHLKDKVDGYFNEPSKIFANRHMHRQNAIAFEKKKAAAMRSAPFLRKNFGDKELAGINFDIAEVTAEESSSLQTSTDSFKTDTDFEISEDRPKSSNHSSQSSLYDINQYSSAAHSQARSSKSANSRVQKQNKVVPKTRLEKADSSDSFLHLPTQKLQKLSPFDVPKAMQKKHSRVTETANDTNHLLVPSKNQEIPHRRPSSSHSRDTSVKKYDMTLSELDRELLGDVDSNSAGRDKVSNYDDTETQFYRGLKDSKSPTINQLQARQIIANNKIKFAKTQQQGFSFSRLSSYLYAEGDSDYTTPNKKSEIDDQNRNQYDQLTGTSSQTKRAHFVQRNDVMLQSTPDLKKLGNFQLGSAPMSRNIPTRVVKTSTKQSPLKQERGIETTSTNLTQSIYSNQKINKANVLNNKFNQFLETSFDKSKVPHDKMSRANYIARLKRSQKQSTELGAQMPVSPNDAMNRIKSPMMKQQILRPYEGKADTLVKPVSSTTASPDKKLNTKIGSKTSRLNQSMNKPIASNSSQRAETHESNKSKTGQALTHRHVHFVKQKDENNAQSQLMLHRRNSLIRPQMQVQLKKLARKEQANKLLNDRIATLERKDTTSTNSLQLKMGSVRQAVGGRKSDASMISISRSERGRYIKILQKQRSVQGLDDSSSRSSLQEENSSQFSSQALSSSSSSSSDSSYFMAQNAQVNVKVSNLDDNAKIDRHSLTSKGIIKEDVFQFLKSEQMRQPEYMFKQLYPLNAFCNEDKNEHSFKRVQVSKHMKEIYVPVREIRQLTPGDDNALARQCMIENTIHRVMKIMNTHDFSKQLANHHN